MLSQQLASSPCSQLHTPTIVGVSVFSHGGPIGQIHIDVGCDLLIRCLPRSLRSVRVARTGSGPPPGTGPGQHGPQAGASEPSESLCPDRACPGPPARTSTGHGLAHSSGRTRWGQRRLGAPPAAGPCAGCTHSNPRDAEAVRPGPAPGLLAGRSITEGGWVGTKLKQLRSSAAREASPRLCRSVPVDPPTAQRLARDCEGHSV